MSNIVELENLVTALLTSKGKDIVSTYTSLSSGNYHNFALWFLYLQNSEPAKNLTGLRLIFCVPDGTVVYDSSKLPFENTFENFKLKKVNENHNSRIAIMKALLSASGRGYEIKRSTSTGAIEAYLAVRIGTSSENPFGLFRISYQP